MPHAPSTANAPSNPSPFSPELQTFIVTKYEPLLSIVKELGDRLQSEESDRYKLERRVQFAERQLKRLAARVHAVLPDDAEELDALANPTPTAEEPRSRPSSSQGDRNMLTVENCLNAPWIFSCKTGTAGSTLQVLLSFSPGCTQELDVRMWTREEDMWISFLEELPEGVAAKPDSLHLTDLRKCARQVTVLLCQAEFLLILRGVPGKHAAATSAMSIALVAVLAAAFSEAWQRVENQDPDSLGRIAVILEGNAIGSRLRGGRQRFNVEPLN